MYSAFDKIIKNNCTSVCFRKSYWTYEIKYMYISFNRYKRFKNIEVS